MKQALGAPVKIGEFVGSLFLNGWLLMLLFGTLHSSFPAVPLWGYWRATIIFSLGILLVNSVARTITNRLDGLVRIGAYFVLRQTVIDAQIEQAIQPSPPDPAAPGGYI